MSVVSLELIIKFVCAVRFAGALGASNLDVLGFVSQIR